MTRGTTRLAWRLLVGLLVWLVLGLPAVSAQSVGTTIVSGTGTTTSAGSGTTRAAPLPWLLALGDSKTADDDWKGFLVNTSKAQVVGPWSVTDRGVPGATVATTIANLAFVLGQPLRATVPLVLINLGVNDEAGLPSQSVWQASYLVLIDAVRAIWPTCTIYLTQVWFRTGASNNLVDTWIAGLIPLRTNLLLCDDERIWLEGGDNGNTMTLDGTHYTPLGELTAAAVKSAVIWP